MPADRQKLIRNAERLVRRGKLNGAIEAYLKVLDDHPDDTSTLNRVGDLYARLNRVDEAVELFHRAAEHFADEGFFVKAIAIYKKILRQDPAQLEAAESLADLQARQRLVNDARTQYRSVIEGYDKRGDRESIARIHGKLVELEPDNPGHRLHLAEVLRELNRIPDAMAQYTAIAQLMLEHDKVGDAVRVCREALELDSANLNFVSSVVGELQRAGYDEEAEEFLAVAVEKNPESAKITALPAPIADEGPPTEAVVAPESAKEEGTEVEEIFGESEALGEEEPVAEWPEVASESATLEAEMEEDVEIELDLGELEPVAAEEKAPPEIDGLAELLIEADVLARYGLEDKAVEKLEEIIEREPQHTEARRRLITLYLEQKNVERVVALAGAFRRICEQQDEMDGWEALRSQLTEEGFEVGEAEIRPPRVERPSAEEVPAVAEVEAEPAPLVVSQDELAEDLSWLEDLAAGDETAKPTDAGVFQAEEDFFDLASELEKELGEEEGLEDELVAPPEEQSLEEIVEGFRKGMAETLSPEDFDTHYNLGIAYREMGLIDEAISEFQLAAKDSRYLVDCCSLLASCFTEKGFPELAIKWYNEGLSSPIITEEETLGLVYELGDLYLTIGQTEEARQRFVEIYGVNSDYRDVGAKLAELD